MDHDISPFLYNHVLVCWQMSAGHGLGTKHHTILFWMTAISKLCWAIVLPPLFDDMGPQLGPKDLISLDLVSELLMCYMIFCPLASIINCLISSLIMW